MQKNQIKYIYILYKKVHFWVSFQGQFALYSHIIAAKLNQTKGAFRELHYSFFNFQWKYKRARSVKNFLQENKSSGLIRKKMPSMQ